MFVPTPMRRADWPVAGPLKSRSDQTQTVTSVDVSCLSELMGRRSTLTDIYNILCLYVFVLIFIRKLCKPMYIDNYV